MPTEPGLPGRGGADNPDVPRAVAGKTEKTVADVRMDVGHVRFRGAGVRSGKEKDMEKNDHPFYGNAVEWSDRAWDRVLGDAGCFASALGRASARFFLQFMPPGTKWAYWTRPQSGIAGGHVRLRVGEFRRTARGRAVYDAAPEDAKRFYSRCVGNATLLDPRQVYDLYRTMDDASWDYILAHAWTPAQRKDLSDARTHMQGHPAGTKMFWWLQ